MVRPGGNQQTTAQTHKGRKALNGQKPAVGCQLRTHSLPGRNAVTSFPKCRSSLTMLEETLSYCGSE